MGTKTKGERNILERVLYLALFLVLPILLYLVLVYFWPLWKEALYGKKDEENLTEKPTLFDEKDAKDENT